jgi:hypothetical protein
VASESTAERFERFHAANPLVYQTLVRLITEWVVVQGRKPLGIRMLWETARWQIIQRTRNTDFKMNDHYTGYYARMLLVDHPSFRGLLEIRKSPADEWAEGYMARTGAA